MSFRINPYRQSVTPYVKPLPLPEVDPDFQTVNVAVSCLWIPYIVGALSVLGEQATWDTTDPDAMSYVLEQVGELRAIFTAAWNDSDCADLLYPFACGYPFGASSAGWIKYAPSNQGLYVSGTGWTGTDQDANSHDCITIISDFPGPIIINRVTLFYTAAATGSGAFNQVRILKRLAGTNSILEVQTPVPSGTNSLVWEGPDTTVDNILLQINMGTTNANTVFFEVIVEGYAEFNHQCT